MGLTRIRAEQISDIDYKQAVRVVATTNSTLSGGTPNQVDGVNLVVGDRVLVTGQSTASQNGIYVVQTVGSGSDGSWTRSSDANATGEIDAGMIIMVTEGSQYADTQWKLTTNNPIVVGVTELTFILNALSVVGGSATQIQYNSGGVLAGDANLAWTGAELFVGGTANVSGNVLAGNVTTTTISGTLSTAAQTNITSLGTLTALDVTGNISGGNLVATNIGGTLTTAAQTNITSVGTLGSLSVTGNITSGNISATGISGTLTTASQTQITAVGTLDVLTVTGNVNTGNVSGTTGSFTNLAGLLTTAAQTNVTSLGTLTSLSVIGNISAGNVSGTNGTFTNVSGNGSALSALNGANISTGTIDSARISGSYTGITAVGTLSTATVTALTTNGIVNGGSNGTGNIGSSTTYFNTVFARATSAQYADLAERYCSDDDYQPGTVLIFGGENEVTQSNQDHDDRVAGVVSTNPAYIMNSALDHKHTVTVALVGRVPCRVSGQVEKGQSVVTSAIPGVAQALDRSRYIPGCIIGKALESHDGTEIGVIEVVVGRL